MRVIDENGQSLDILSKEKALDLAKEKDLDLIEIAPNAKPPVAKIISYDKFRYQKKKEEKRQGQAQKAKGLKQVRISPRTALNDLQIKLAKVKEFLAEGHKVEISIYLRGREKGNRAWGFQKLKNFMAMITTPHIITMEPRAGGRGFIAQITKK